MSRAFPRMVVGSLIGLAASALISRPDPSAQQLAIAIDLETAPVVDLATITPTYTGAGPVVYAFLVITGGESITGVITGYRLESDGSIVNDGFTCLSDWMPASGEAYGFDVDLGGPGRSGPLALGYWTLRLRHGSSSWGSLGLVAPGGVNGETVIVLDGDHRALPVPVLHHAAVNATVPAPTTQASSFQHALSPSYHILCSIKQEALALPAGVVGAPLAAVTAIDRHLAAILEEYIPIRIDKVFVQSTPADSIFTTSDGLPVHLPELWNVYKLTLSDSTGVAGLIADLKETAIVSYAETNGVGTLALLPNDEHFEEQWNLQNTGQEGGTPDADVDAPEGWDTATGTNSVMLGIVDTGVDESHEDLDGRIIVGENGYSAWHGTIVTSVAAAETNNGDGIAGVDWKCIIDSEIHTNDAESVAQNIWDAVTRGAQVINVSWGTLDNSETLRDAVYATFLMGRHVVACMHNDYGNVRRYPAGWSEIVTAVGATTNTDVLADFSNWGSWVDVTAPGQHVLTAVPGQYGEDDYWFMDGTSLSAPCVAGIGSLLLGQNPTLVDVDIEQIIERTADDRGISGFDDHYGWGRVNLANAVEYVQARLIQHRYVPSGSVYEADHTDWYRISWFDPPGGWPSGSYFVRRYDMRADIQYGGQFLDTPDLWIRLAGTTGLDDANPRYYDWPWGMVQSQGPVSATLKTFIYEVRTYPDLRPVGWWPVARNQVTFAYTRAGHPAAGEVTEQVVGGGFAVVLKGENPRRGSDGAECAFEVTTPAGGRVRMEVLDIAGRLLRDLDCGLVSPGKTVVRWNGRLSDGLRVTSGVYLVRIIQDGVGEETRKVVIQN